MNIKLSEKDKIQISNSYDVFGIMQRILLRDNRIDRAREHFWVIGMNNAGYILYIELIGLGTSRAVLIEPMNIFRVAVLKGAIRVVLVHNHPSGNLKPSARDLDITDRLIQVGRILDIKVDEHLVINTEKYFSFLDESIMEELEKSTKYVPTFELIDRVRKEEKGIRVEAEKKHKQELSIKKQELRTHKQELLKQKEELKETERQRDNAVYVLFEKELHVEQISEVLGIALDEVKKIIRRKPKA